MNKMIAMDAMKTGRAYAEGWVGDPVEAEWSSLPRLEKALMEFCGRMGYTTDYARVAVAAAVGVLAEACFPGE